MRVASLRTMLRCERADPQIIVPLAESADKRVRAAAIAALAKHSGRDAPRWFARGLKDPSACVRVETAALLSRLDPAEHRGAIFELALYDPNPEIARRAEELTAGKGYAKLTWWAGAQLPWEAQHERAQRRYIVRDATREVAAPRAVLADLWPSSAALVSDALIACLATGRTSSTPQRRLGQSGQTSGQRDDKAFLGRSETGTSEFSLAPPLDRTNSSFLRLANSGIMTARKSANVVRQVLSGKCRTRKWDVTPFDEPSGRLR